MAGRGRGLGGGGGDPQFNPIDVIAFNGPAWPDLGGAVLQHAAIMDIWPQ
jgi:hypothetical protein